MKLFRPNPPGRIYWPSKDAEGEAEQAADRADIDDHSGAALAYDWHLVLLLAQDSFHRLRLQAKGCQTLRPCRHGFSRWLSEHDRAFRITATTRSDASFNSFRNISRSQSGSEQPAHSFVPILFSELTLAPCTQGFSRFGPAY